MLNHFINYYKMGTKALATMRSISCEVNRRSLVLSISGHCYKILCAMELASADVRY
jgi:hypothetical protein